MRIAEDDDIRLHIFGEKILKDTRIDSLKLDQSDETHPDHRSEFNIRSHADQRAYRYTTESITHYLLNKN
jgi:hypothetical protein